MKALLTGGSGFVAGHLVNELRGAGYEVVLTDRVSPAAGSAGVPFYPVDLTDSAAVSYLLEAVRPDAIVHLGAIAFVPAAARDPEELMRINVGGTVKLLDARREVVPNARFLFVSTAQVLQKPLSPYAHSKLIAEERVKELGGENWIIARPSNHTGPFQRVSFVVPSFVKQALDIRSGRADHFVVGNLEAVRDFTDVRDVVRAYRLLLEKGDCGKCYAIGSKVRLSMAELLGKIQHVAGVAAPAIIDPARWRPADSSQELDLAEIQALGWRPEIELEVTLRDMVLAYRALALG